jgi:ATP-binding cassette subfamily B protein
VTKSGATRLGNIARLFVRFGPLLKPHRRRLALSACFMLAFIATDLVGPWPIQGVIDGVLLERRNRGFMFWLGGILPSDRMQLLAVCCLAVVVLTALKGLFSYSERILAESVGQKVVSDLRVAIFARLQRLSLTFHSRRRTGDLMVRLTGDVTMLREVLVPMVLEFTTQALVILGMIAFMAMMDPTLTLIAVSTLPLLLVATARYGGLIRQASREQRRKEGKVATVASEALASVTMIQAYSREEEVAARFSRQSFKSLSAGLRSLRLEESLGRIVEMTIAVGSCLVLWVGARRSLAGGMSPGEMVVFLAYLKGLYKPTRDLVRIGAKASKAAVCGERILEILDSGEEVREAPDAIPAPPLSGEIAFEGVTFGYQEGRPVLQDLSLRIAPGERVGLVGPSGSGKSTILALLLRLYDPQAGRILVDGQDIRRFQLESYRRQIAIVLQEPFLFGDSVETNIRCGRPEATREQVRAAATAAGAHPFLEALPDGYDSILGERGTSLSRGQQQRVSLARAVLREAPVMVFDEPTTGLDPRTELDVRRTLSRMASGRTCVWIAHNLSQILDCERVIVIREGRVVETGPPAELLTGVGPFRRLFGEAKE